MTIAIRSLEWIKAASIQQPAWIHFAWCECPAKPSVTLGLQGSGTPFRAISHYRSN